MDAPVFPPDAAIRRIAAEPGLIVAGSRALLLQLAHPKIAQGVAEHSDFDNDPLSRLRGTLDFLSYVVFGKPGEAENAAGLVASVHEGVRGPSYSANDTDLQCWVNATLTDSALEAYGRLFRPVPDRIADSYIADAARIAELLGCPVDAQPTDVTAFRRYMAETLPTLQVTDTARRLAHAVLSGGGLPAYLRPGMPANYFITVGLLPPSIREQYHFSWSANQDRLLSAALRAGGLASSLVPLRLRMRGPQLYLWRARRRRPMPALAQPATG